jgi:hypothetical protein
MPTLTTNRFCALRPDYARICGGYIPAALMLDALASWSRKEEWHKWSRRYIVQDTGGALSNDTVATASERLIAWGYMERRGDPRKGYEYRLMVEKVNEDIATGDKLHRTANSGGRETPTATKRPTRPKRGQETPPPVAGKPPHTVAGKDPQPVAGKPPHQHEESTNTHVKTPSKTPRSLRAQARDGQEEAPNVRGDKETKEPADRTPMKKADHFGERFPDSPLVTTFDGRVIPNPYFNGSDNECTKLTRPRLSDPLPAPSKKDEGPSRIDLSMSRDLFRKTFGQHDEES